MTKKSKQPAEADPSEAERVAVLLVDGGYWRRMAKNASVDDAWRRSMGEVEAKLGCRVNHVTWLDSDPGEFLMEAVNEGMTNRHDLAICQQQQSARLQFFNDLRAHHGPAELDLQLKGYKFQRIRQVVPSSNPGARCQYLYRSGLAQRGVDVSLAVRALEYAHGFVSGLVPTDLVCLTADSDLAAAFASLNVNAPRLRLWLSGFANESRARHGAAGEEAPASLRLCSALEAYVPRERRVYLTSPAAGDLPGRGWAAPEAAAAYPLRKTPDAVAADPAVAGTRPSSHSAKAGEQPAAAGAREAGGTLSPPERGAEIAKKSGKRARKAALEEEAAAPGEAAGQQPGKKRKAEASAEKAEGKKAAKAERRRSKAEPTLAERLAFLEGDA